MGGGNVITITSTEHWKEQLERAKTENKAIVVDFFAEWCGPCKMIKPKYEAFSEQYTNVIFLTVNVDDLQEIAGQCSISAMPTFQIFQNGAKVDEQVGASAEKLSALIARYNA